MYAIIESGGKQFTVTEGSRLRIEKVAKEVGDEIAIQEVLVVNNDETTLLGAPYVAGASGAAGAIRAALAAARASRCCRDSSFLRAR